MPHLSALKKPAGWLSLTLLGLLPLTALHAQQAGTYTAVAAGSSATAYTALQPTTAAALRTAGTADEGYYNALPLGFSFRFAGSTYTTVSASTNGWLTFGQAIADATPTNNLTSGPVRPLLAPLWDDLSFGTPAADPATDGNFFYQTTGTVGSRIFTAEWRNVRWAPTAAGPVMSCLVRLFEGTNVVQFQYLQGTTSSAGTRSASAGLAGPTAGDFLSLSDLQLTATFSSTTETNNITGRATSGRIYTFTPPAATASRRGQAANPLQLMPNPAQGRVRAQGLPVGAALVLTDLQGRVVRRFAPAAPDRWLDVGGLAPGLYLLTTQAAGQPAYSTRLVLE